MKLKTVNLVWATAMNDETGDVVDTYTVGDEDYDRDVTLREINAPDSAADLINWLGDEAEDYPDCLGEGHDPGSAGCQGCEYPEKCDITKNALERGSFLEDSK